MKSLFQDFYLLDKRLFLFSLDRYKKCFLVISFCLIEFRKENLEKMYKSSKLMNLTHVTESMNAQDLPDNIILTNLQIVSSVLVENSSFKRISKLREAIRFIYETLQMWIDRIRFKAEKRTIFEHC